MVQSRRDWVEALDLHALAYNASFHRAIHNTPYFLNFGRDPRLPIDNRLGVTESVRLREFGRTRAVDAAAVLAWTAARLAETQSAMKERYDSHQRDVSVRPGDLVLLREEGQIPKSAPRWSGPFRVAKVSVSGLEVDVHPLYRPTAIFTVALQRLRPYTASDLNPLERQLAPSSTLPVPSPSVPAPPVEVESSPMPDIVIPLSAWGGPGSRTPASVRQSPLAGAPATLPSEVSEHVPDVSPRAGDAESVRQSRSPLSAPEVLRVPSQTPASSDVRLAGPSLWSDSEPGTATSVDSGGGCPDSTESGRVTETNASPSESARSSSAETPVVLITPAASDCTASTLFVPQSETPSPESTFPDPPVEPPASPVPPQIDSLVGYRTRRGMPFYRVRWVGSADESWVRIDQLPAHLVAAYDAAHGIRSRTFDT
jgi:hypothetical protein